MSKNSRNRVRQDMAKRMCSNCRVDIPAGLTFDLHEASCRKYCKYCRECGETVPLSELSAHESKAHTPTPCPQCRASVHPAHTDSHKDVCPQAMVVCKYCELEKPRKHLRDHLDACGSRTQECDLCTLRVKLRDMEEHQAIKCGHLRAEPNLDPHTLEHLTSDPNTTSGSTMHGDVALALRLQEEEHNLPHSVPHRPPHNLPHTDVELARMLQDEEVRRDRIFGRDLELAQQLQQEEETHSTHPHYHPPAEEPPSVEGLPCQFCGQLFPSQTLTLHQNSCCDSVERVPKTTSASYYESVPTTSASYYESVPTTSASYYEGVPTTSASYYESVPTTSASYYEGRSQQTASYEGGGIEEKLPCESCGQLFPFSTLHRHQVACSLHPPNSDYN